jgi:hypothetical protein
MVSVMSNISVPEDRRTLVDHYLTELGLYAKQLCPDAKVEMLSISYEGEDGHVRVFVPFDFADSEVEKLDNKLADKSVDILLTTGLSILVGVFESP